MHACADLLQRLGEAEALIRELRSRILGLTALNADLTRQLREGADETAALRAAEARSEELEAQLEAAAKEAAGVQVPLLLLLVVHAVLLRERLPLMHPCPEQGWRAALPLGSVSALGSIIRCAMPPIFLCVKFGKDNSA